MSWGRVLKNLAQKPRVMTGYLMISAFKALRCIRHQEPATSASREWRRSSSIIYEQKLLKPIRNQDYFRGTRRYPDLVRKYPVLSFGTEPQIQNQHINQQITSLTQGFVIGRRMRSRRSFNLFRYLPPYTFLPGCSISAPSISDLILVRPNLILRAILVSGGIFVESFTKAAVNMYRHMHAYMQSWDWESIRK